MDTEKKREENKNEEEKKTRQNEFRHFSETAVFVTKDA